jgi:hypothetical protein
MTIPAPRSDTATASVDFAAPPWAEDDPVV